MDTEYLKRVGIYILSAILSVGLVFYLGYHIWRSVTREVETSPVSETQAEKTVETNAYVFRNEEVLSYSSASGGGVVPTVNEGEKIKIGGEVARVYSNSSPDIVARIAEIEEQIQLLKDCSADGTVSLKDSSSLDGDIYSMLLQMRGDGDEGKAGDALSLRSKFITSVNKRLILTGSVSDFSAEAAELEGEKASLTNQLGSCLEKITAPQSGYYYSEADGYESIFKASDLESIDFDSLTKLLSSPGVTTGTRCAGKLVNDPEWYIVCTLPRSYYDVYTVGGTCLVNFSASGISVNMDVYRIIGTGDTFAIILRTTEMPEKFNFERCQQVELVTAEYTGFKVPVSAVRLVDSYTGVYILDGSTVRFRRISVLFQSEGSYIVETDPEDDAGSDDYPWLQLHDSLIIEGKGMLDGKVRG